MTRQPGRPNLALADFVAPRESGVADFIGLFAVTAGHGVGQLVEQYERANDDYSAILAKALADRLAEALAERLHARVRREFWGYAGNESLDQPAIIREQYQGIRPAPGYPACPDHTEKRTLFDLLGAEEKAGIRLTESFRDAACCLGERLLLLAAGSPVTSDWERSGRTRLRTTPGAKE